MSGDVGRNSVVKNEYFKSFTKKSKLYILRLHLIVKLWTETKFFTFSNNFNIQIIVSQ